MLTSGFIASSAMGWPGLFRLYGAAGMLLAGLMWMVLADSPAKHPKISAEERAYIEQELVAPKVSCFVLVVSDTYSRLKSFAEHFLRGKPVQTLKHSLLHLVPI